MFVRFVCPNINDQGWSLLVRVWKCGWIRAWHHFQLITLELFRALLLYMYTEGCFLTPRKWLFSYGFLRVKILPKIGSTKKNTPRSCSHWHHLKMGGKTWEDEANLETPSISSFELNLSGLVVFCSNIWVPKTLSFKKKIGQSCRSTTRKCTRKNHFSLKLKEPIKNWRFLVSMLKQLLEKSKQNVYDFDTQSYIYQKWLFEHIFGYANTTYLSKISSDLIFLGLSLVSKTPPKEQQRNAPPALVVVKERRRPPFPMEPWRIVSHTKTCFGSFFDWKLFSWIGFCCGIGFFFWLNFLDWVFCCWIGFCCWIEFSVVGIDHVFWRPLGLFLEAYLEFLPVLGCDRIFTDGWNVWFPCR